MFAKVMFSQVFVCQQGGSLSRDNLCPGMGSLFRGGLCQGLPLYGKERAVRILLECILVNSGLLTSLLSQNLTPNYSSVQSCINQQVTPCEKQ